MPQTLKKLRFNPKYKIKPTTEKLTLNSATLPSNPQNSKLKLLSGKGLLIYK